MIFSDKKHIIEYRVRNNLVNYKFIGRDYGGTELMCGGIPKKVKMIKEGMNLDFTISKTSSGMLFVEYKRDDNLFLLFGESMECPADAKDKFDILLERSISNSDTYGSSLSIIQVKEHCNDSCLVFSKYNIIHHDDRLSDRKFYIVHNKNVYVVNITEIEMLSCKLGIEIPVAFEHTSKGIKWYKSDWKCI